MCGICGISASHAETIDSGRLVKDMLLDMESRGSDATGIAWTGADNKVWINKANIPASLFVKELDVPKNTGTIIAHTRLATQGSPNNNDNNHPIDVNGIVGVHNGFISNDYIIFDEILGKETRIAQVDSEAAFALLGSGCSPTSEVLDSLEGSAALAWIDTLEPDIINLARVSWSPLVIGKTEKGSLLFASTQSCIVKTAKKQELEVIDIEHLEEGDYLQVKNGEILTRVQFIKKKRRALNIPAFDHDYASPSAYSNLSVYVDLASSRI